MNVTKEANIRELLKVAMEANIGELLNVTMEANIRELMNVTMEAIRGLMKTSYYGTCGSHCWFLSTSQECEARFLFRLEDSKLFLSKKLGR